MKLLFLSILNIMVIFSNISYSHDNLEQHAIVHVYPFLEEKYINDEKAKCKMGILKIYNCNSSAGKKITKSSK